MSVRITLLRAACQIELLVEADDQRLCSIDIKAQPSSDDGLSFKLSLRTGANSGRPERDFERAGDNGDVHERVGGHADDAALENGRQFGLLNHFDLTGFNLNRSILSDSGAVAKREAA